MNVLLLVTTGQIVKLFRIDLIKKLVERGHKVTVAADFSQGNIDGDFDKVDISLSNRSKSVVKTLNYYRHVKKIVKAVSPDVVMTFMIKPNTIGVLAAKKAVPNARIFAMVEGMGVVYTEQSLKFKAIRLITNFLYKKSMKNVDGLFCLNKYDVGFFRSHKYINDDKIHCIPGIGVDLERFKYTDVTNFSRFVFVARMLKEKGVEEFCRMASIVKKDYPEAEFEMYGAEEKETSDCIKEYASTGAVKYCGITSDVAMVLRESTALILPTYREGASRIIMEAMACGRPVIASNTIGCDHLVDDGKTGYLVAVKDVDGLVKAVKRLIDSRETVINMGNNGRKKAVDVFDAEKINEKICKIVEDEK